MQTRLIRLSGDQYQKLRAHLFPGDGREAVALALCGRLESQHVQALCVHKLLLIPHDQCHERTPIRVSWPTVVGRKLYEEAMAKHLAVLKIHSHPTEFADFSRTDDHSDRELFSSLHGWTDDGLPHASAVLMEAGDMIARFVNLDLEFLPVDRIAVAGDDLLFFDHAPLPLLAGEDRGKGDHGDAAHPLPGGEGRGESQTNRRRFATLAAAQMRTAQAFGEKTVRLLASHSIGVVGCSGTGSWVIEQLNRLGVGRLVEVDPDLMELKNLNRIINSRRADADAARPKVETIAEAVRATGLVQDVVPMQKSCFAPDAIKELASCDILFGCMDTHDGRDLLNRLATFYCIPLFDLGVHLEADGHGSVSAVCGSVHYLLPGGSSLLSRGVYTPSDIRAAALRRTNPDQFQAEQEEGYIKRARVSSPAVVSVNGLCATLAMNNLLARLHPFRSDPNAEIRWQTFDLVNTAFTTNDDGPPCKALLKYVGRGDMDPPLDSVF
jgi:hypothetical protein